MKNWILLFGYLLIATASLAQREGNIWYFGNKAGLDFNNGSPVVLTNSSLRAFEGSASIADADGKLLFYTDGITVWNRLHQVMENGTGLMGDSSSTQSAIIVPQPGNRSLYYIFTVDNIGGPDGLRYSVADMTQNSNSGAIISKNNLLIAPVTEKITAVKHSNNSDLWVIAHGWNNNLFYAYLITASGIVNKDNPVISKVGAIHSGSPTNAIGYLKASPDGRKLALGIRQMQTYELFDFDNMTGTVSNVTTFKSASYNSPYGVEFSPDGSKLYINATLSPTARIYQIDLRNDNTVTLVGTSKSPYAGALQLGPDGKIYFARYENITKGGNSYLGVIHEPNAAGTACTYLDDGLYLEGRTSLFGLPAFIQSYFHKPLFTFNNACFGDATMFQLATDKPVQKVQWLFDDPVASLLATSTEVNPTYTFTVSGAHEVAVRIWHQDGSFTEYSQSVEIKPSVSVELGKDTLICPGQSLLLNAYTEGAAYKWQDNSTEATLTVQGPGIYWVDVTLNQCTTRDSILIGSIAYAESILGKDTTICKGSTLRLSAPDNEASYRWQDGSTGNLFTVKDAGIYWVEAITPCGKIKDSIVVTNASPPTVNFAKEYLHYNVNQPLVLDALQDSPHATYRWQDGSTEAKYAVYAPGTYWVEITNSCGTVKDSATVKEPILTYSECISADMPNVITPNGDGANDSFVIPCMQNQDWEIAIYNRWGKIVYQSYKYRGDWQANDLANGAYYYTLLNKLSGTSLKGIIHVLR